MRPLEETLKRLCNFCLIVEDCYLLVRSLIIFLFNIYMFNRESECSIVYNRKGVTQVFMFFFIFHLFFKLRFSIIYLISSTR